MSDNILTIDGLDPPLHFYESFRRYWTKRCALRKILVGYCSRKNTKQLSLCRQTVGSLEEKIKASLPRKVYASSKEQSGNLVEFNGHGGGSLKSDDLLGRNS
ncbi:Dof type zinc finger protein [Striga asiatica]|uniref:Dof type zinc finger protein n=1 Tax=Striga asiatica TaxID=4170 RepID=A0A5A7Q587_STRAF|nr:Dof type zinc finger protein [Striga asiatica]